LLAGFFVCLNMRVILFPLPISNPSTIAYSSYELDFLKTTKLYFVEKTKTARQFIASRKLNIDLNELEFVEIDQKNGSEFQKEVATLVEKYKQAIVMSESGCPGVADPGSQVVAVAHRIGADVIPLVGPSSIILALMGSGLNGQHFQFHGYLPIDKQLRNATLQKLESESWKINCAQLFIEAPHRNQALFEAMLERLKPETRLCVALDLTGEKEWLKTKTIAQWRKNTTVLDKLPTMFIIGK